MNGIEPEDMKLSRVAWLADRGRAGLPFPGVDGLDGFAAGWDEGFAAGCAPADTRVKTLENERDALLSALCRAVEIITGRLPQAAEIRRKFLERGELPSLTP